MMSLEERARSIRLVCTDIDGVLTSGELHYDGSQGHTKSFHVRDGAAIKWLQRCGIPVAFISGLDSPATQERARHLGIEDCFLGHLAKKPVLETLRAKYGLELSQVAHLGDDLADLPGIGLRRGQIGGEVVLKRCPLGDDDLQYALHVVDDLGEV